MIDVKPGAFSLAYLAVIREVTNNQKLANRRIVQTWHHWTSPGKPPDMQSCALPAVQTKLIGRGIKLLASEKTPGGGPWQSTSEATFHVQFDLWTPGPDVRDLLNVGELIFDVFYPDDRAERLAVQERLELAGITAYRWVAPIAPPVEEAYGTAACLGSGALEIVMQIRT